MIRGDIKFSTADLKQASLDLAEWNNNIYVTYKKFFIDGTDINQVNDGVHSMLKELRNEIGHNVVHGHD